MGIQAFKCKYNSHTLIHCTYNTKWGDFWKSMCNLENVRIVLTLCIQYVTYHMLDFNTGFFNKTKL